MSNKPMLVFQTDFTYKEGAVCAMYGVVKSVDRSLEIIDGSHELPQYDIWSASYRLYQSMEFWPTDTIFVSVVDPGVGTARRACVAKTVHGHMIVTPDNGALTHVKRTIGITEVREIDESINRLQRTKGVAIFHGRDLFGYCAARLASGIISFEEVGPVYPVEEIVELPIAEASVQGDKVCGIFEINDPNFGNLWTNIPLEMFTEAGFAYGDMLNVRVINDGKVAYEDRVLFEKSFGYAQKGDVMIYNNELMRVAMAVSMGNFTEQYHLNYGGDWQVEFTK
ncbi:MAG: DNA-directed RNA polymerase subunit delta [Clostridiales bacterium]|nr:DNA-directed RNA polymerase subunit delta [Clostridiales bacterium]